MVREILKIYTDNGLGDSNPAFKDIELTEYSAKFLRMGFPDLTATLMWPTPLDDEWTHKEYAVLRGERFYIRHTPSSSKSNTDARYKHEISFTSEFAEILGKTYFVDAVESYSATYDKPCTNNTTFKFYGTIAEFVDRLNCAFLAAGIGDSILKNKTSLTTDDSVSGDGFCAMLDPYGDYDPDKVYEFSFEDKFLWEAITYGFETTEIPFERRGKRVIFGAVPKVVDHKFEYGYDNELLSISKKNANAKVINRITMLGSSENIPHYYPNETEYGHIGIAAMAGNKVLTADMVSIANMTQMLSRMNADDYAVLCKDYGEDGAGAVVDVYNYSSGINDGVMLYNALGEYISYTPSADNGEYSLWHIYVYFKVEVSGEVECRDIRGNVWMQNTPPPTDGIDMMGGVILEKLESYFDVTLGSESADYTSQLERRDDAIYMGYLPQGRYGFKFAIRIRNFSAEDGTPITSYCRLTSAAIGEAAGLVKGYYWQVGDTKYDGAGALGVKIAHALSDDMVGDGFGWTASGRMPFQSNLMPPKYRNTEGNERFYNALNAPYTEDYASQYPSAYADPDNIDPETKLPKPYVFPNPYIDGAPSEHIFRSDTCKPTIEGVRNNIIDPDTGLGQLFGEIADIAFDDDDNDALKAESSEDGDKNDSLKYEHSFFYIKLNIFNGQYGFDLIAHYSQTNPMTLQMRSGSCNGCKFKVQVLEYTDSTGLKSYKNPVHTTGIDGDIVGGNYPDKVKKDWQTWQQNTQSNSIWICVQKDASTFGVIMPNKSNDYKPAIGDTFNIINIDLPLPYWYAAEKRLEEEGMRYMSDNNDEKFSFDIAASRIYLAENPDVMAELDEYSKIKVVYDGKSYEQYVNQLSIDCKDSEALPNIGIDLTDTLAVGQGFAENVAERAASLIANATTLGGNLGTGGGGMSAALSERRYLNKQMADRTPFKLSTDTAFEVGEFVSGASGGIFMRDPDTGETYIEADKLKIRAKAIFEALEILKNTSIGGKQTITPGGAITISFVEKLPRAYRCYFKAKEENRGATCQFVVNDQVQCAEFNATEGVTQNAANRYYWRKVTAVNNDKSYVELSKADCHKDDEHGIYSDEPQAGDTIVQLGNADDKYRQSAIVLSTVDADAPSIKLFAGIDSYSLDGKAVVSFGQDPLTGDVYFRLGESGAEQYLDYTQADGLTVAGKIGVTSTIGDKSLGAFVSDSVGVYSLEGSPAYVRRDFDGTLSETTVFITQYRSNGNGKRETSDDNYIRVKRVGEDANFSGGIKSSVQMLSITEKTTEVLAMLLDSAGIVLDSISIPVLTDASTMDIGGDNMLPNTNKGTRNWEAETYLSGNSAAAGTLVLSKSSSGKGVKITLQGGTDSTGNNLYDPENTTYQAKFQIPAATLEGGREYTLSFKVKGNVADADLVVSLNKDNFSSYQIVQMGFFSGDTIRDGAMHRVKSTFTVPSMKVISGGGGGIVNSTYYKNNPLGLCFYVLAKETTQPAWHIEIDDLQIEWGNVATQWKPHIYDMDYMVAAMRESTTIEGGLILSTLIQLGYTEDSAFKIMSGLSGLFAANERGGGLAFWAGGKMIDAEDDADEGSTAGIRHDGTAYFCKNTVRFKDKELEIGKYARFDELGMRILRDDGSVGQAITGDVKTNGPADCYSGVEGAHTVGFDPASGQISGNWLINDKILSTAWKTDKSATVTFGGGTITIQITSQDVDDNEGFVNGVDVKLLLERFSDAQCTSLISQYLVDSKIVYAPRGVTNIDTMSLTARSITTTGAGYLRFRLRVTSIGTSFATRTISWSGLSAVSRTEFYTSQYFANGFCLGTRSNEYVSAWHNDTDGLNFEVRTPDYGLRVRRNSIDTYVNGAWIPMPKMIFRGLACLNNATYRWYWDSNPSYIIATPSSPLPTFTKITGNKVKIHYPTEWKNQIPSKLGMSGLNITLTPLAVDGVAPVAMAYSMDSTGITVAMDGAFVSFWIEICAV